MNSQRTIQNSSKKTPQSCIAVEINVQTFTWAQYHWFRTAGYWNKTPEMFKSWSLVDTKWKAVLTHGILRTTKCGVCSCNHSRADSAKTQRPNVGCLYQSQTCITVFFHPWRKYSIHVDCFTLSWVYIDPLFPRVFHKYAKNETTVFLFYSVSVILRILLKWRSNCDVWISYPIILMTQETHCKSVKLFFPERDCRT